MSDLRNKFQEQGYLIIDAGLSESVLAGAVRRLEKHFFGNENALESRVPYADFNRLQDAWYVFPEILEIALSEKILSTLETLYQAPARAFQTLNFIRGTEQAVHADSIHFNSEPFGMMCGVWVALEDIGPEQGPLVYYPGSQHLPEMNYQDFGLEPNSENYPRYLGELEKLIEEHGFQPEYGLIKKGQAVIWSANILHGGSAQQDKSRTRLSQVTHYYMGDPKCWRPAVTPSKGSKRFYFEPDWVRDPQGQAYVPFVPEQIEPSFIEKTLDRFNRHILRKKPSQE